MSEGLNQIKLPKYPTTNNIKSTTCRAWQLLTQGISISRLMRQNCIWKTWQTNYIRQLYGFMPNDPHLIIIKLLNDLVVNSVEI